MAPIPLSAISSRVANIAAKLSSAAQPHQSSSIRPSGNHDPHYFEAESLKRAIPLELFSLSKRQSNQVVAIPTTYDNLNSGPAPGVVAGIVLGSVAGFLLLLYFTYTIFTLGRGGFRRNETIIEEEVVRRRSRSPRRSRSRSEVLEVRTPPPRRQSRRETVTEIRETVSRPRSRSVVSSSHGGGEDIVEVIEEHSPAPPKRKPSRGVSGSFRTIDPLEPGGGRAPRQSMRGR
ncbi:MAG: hypothetical protein Q9160_009191 [Pyrenula sp. 1 TL-2023]